MPTRLVAVEDGMDIPLDRTMVVVGRHPQCDARLDSLRVSRHHCCMTQDNGEVVVRDLGSTNGIRINGQRVEIGRLRPGDELSIAHIRYRLEGGFGPEATMADPVLGGGGMGAALLGPRFLDPKAPHPEPSSHGGHRPSREEIENPLAAAVRDILPASLADKCRIQVILKMDHESAIAPEASSACRPDSPP